MEKEQFRTLNQFKALLRFSGSFNIIAAGLFIFPVLFEHYLQFWNMLNSLCGFENALITIPTDPFHALFINTAGIDLVLIGAIILYVSRDPIRNKGIIIMNAMGRTLFTILTVYYHITADLLFLFVIIGIVDLCISLGFIYFLWKMSKNTTKQQNLIQI